MTAYLHTASAGRAPESATPGVARAPSPAERAAERALTAILTRVRLLARRRVSWLEHQRSQNPARESTGGTPAAVGVALLDLDAPEEEQRFYRENADARKLGARAAEMASACLTEGSPLAALVARLELDDDEVDLLQVCLAPEIEPSLGEVYAHLNGDPERRYATEALAARLCGKGRRVLLHHEGALDRWRILSRREAGPSDPALRVDPYVVDWLHGRVEMDPEVRPYLSIVSSEASLSGWPLASLAERISHALTTGLSTRIHISGPPRSGRRTLAATVTGLFGVRLLAVDTARVPATLWPDVRLRVERLSLMHGCLVAWYGPAIDAALQVENRLLLEFVITETPHDLPPPAVGLEERVEMPRLTSDDRRALWDQMLPASQAWPEAARRELAERYPLQVGDIQHVAAHGVREPEEAKRLCREITRGRLGEQATLLECPFTRADLELSPKLDQLLDELLFEATDRARFWEDAQVKRLFPRGTGLVALMTGPPGTGKTMAAQVIARELGLDLFRIDVSATVDKYIGETAKNLRRLFRRAADMNAVLFFDEADALFSKRTDVRDSHDRYANADTNYLLQLVEDYPGIALLASNKRQNLDEAFVRRIRYLMYFPRPEPAQRLAIWCRLARELAGDEAVERLRPELERLASLVDTTGAQVKNAMLGAAFLARRDGAPLSVPHIRRALERELANEGRTLPLPSPNGARRGRG